MSKVPTLLVGLPPGHPAGDTHPMTKAGKYDPSTIGAQLKEMQGQLAQSAYACEMFLFSPEEPVQSLITKLEEKSWKVIVVGYGVRGHPELTPLLETIINTAHEHAPQAKFAFNTSPISTLAALKRVWPVDE